jgi:hypothetical protein
MNQRIIKLGLESGMLNYVEHETPRHYFLCANADEECLAKFAELIVKECVTVLEQHHPYTIDPEAYHYAISLIEEHFGVEK